jgi:hypothetical protein
MGPARGVCVLESAHGHREGGGRRARDAPRPVPCLSVGACLSVVCVCQSVCVVIAWACSLSLSPPCRTLGQRLPVPHLPNTRAPYACTSTEHSRHTYRCQRASVLTHWHASSAMHRRHAQAGIAPARAPPACQRLSGHPARGRCCCSRMHLWPRRVHGDPAPAY